MNALKPEDIDFDKKLIHINATVTKGMDERVFIKEGAKLQKVRDMCLLTAN